MYIPELPAWWCWTVVLSPAAVTLWRGDWSLRLVAGVLLWQAFNSYSPLTSWSIGWPTDLATLAVCLVLVFRGFGYWTVWAAASAFLSLLTDVLVATFEVTRWVEASMQLAWAHVLSFSVIGGSLLRAREATALAGERPGSSR